MTAVRKNGLRLVGDIHRIAKVGTSERISQSLAPDLLIVSTKSYDTKSAIRDCRRYINGDTKVLTLQNGLGNLELLREWKGEKAFGGTTTMGAVLVRPGVVQISGLGITTIGGDIDSRGAREIARAFASCGLKVQVKRDVMREIWGKAVINACINPTAATLRVRNGRLLEGDATIRLMREICRECELVARANKISLPKRDMFSRVIAVCRNTSGNISSMLQDVQNRRTTEIEQINGAFCSAGRTRGIPTPLNSTLVAMIESL